MPICPRDLDSWLPDDEDNDPYEDNNGKNVKHAEILALSKGIKLRVLLLALKNCPKLATLGLPNQSMIHKRHVRKSELFNELKFKSLVIWACTSP